MKTLQVLALIALCVLGLGTRLQAQKSKALPLGIRQAQVDKIEEKGNEVVIRLKADAELNWEQIGKQFNVHQEGDHYVGQGKSRAASRYYGEGQSLTIAFECECDQGIFTSYCGTSGWFSCQSGCVTPCRKKIVIRI